MSKVSKKRRIIVGIVIGGLVLFLLLILLVFKFINADSGAYGGIESDFQIQRTDGTGNVTTVNTTVNTTASTFTAMTMDMVLALAEQETVTWEDLEGYEYLPIGSGIPYNRYNLDEEYYVLTSTLSEIPYLELYNIRMGTKCVINENADAVRAFVSSDGAYCGAEVEEPIYEELSEFFDSCEEPMQKIVKEAKAWSVAGNPPDSLMDIQYDTSGIYSQFERYYPCIVYENQSFSIPNIADEKKYLNDLNANETLKAGLDDLEETVERIGIDIREDDIEVVFEMNSECFSSARDEEDGLYRKYYVVYSEREPAEQSEFRLIEENWYLFIYEY